MLIENVACWIISREAKITSHFMLLDLSPFNFILQEFGTRITVANLLLKFPREINLIDKLLLSLP